MRLTDVSRFIINVSVMHTYFMQIGLISAIRNGSILLTGALLDFSAPIFNTRLHKLQTTVCLCFLNICSRSLGTIYILQAH